MGYHVKPWTPAEVARLKTLCSSNTLFMKEIAEKLGRRAQAVRWKARKLGVFSKPVGRMGKWNSKHAHLREPVLKYYLTHSFKETAERFGLTASEMKSCISYAYMDPTLKHIRKEWRPHTPWTVEDWVFMARHAGVRPREWVARKLKRGETYNSVKDSLAKFRGAGRYMNGMPWGWAEHLFGDEARVLVLKMKAGPTGLSGRNGKTTSTYQLLPWTDCEALMNKGLTRPILGKGHCTPARRKRAPRVKLEPEVRSAIRAMAQFQRWIHGAQSPRGVRNKLQAALKGK